MSTSTTQAELFSAIRPEYSNNAIASGLATGLLTPEDASLIREFIAEIRASVGICTGRVNMLSYNLVGWRRFIGPYRTLTMGDVYSGIDALKAGKSQKGKPFKQNTLADHVVILKRFLLWAIENEYMSLPEKKVRALKPPAKNTVTKKASDLLTPDEITAIIQACKKSDDRALIMLLYEGGFRIGEIAQMTWGDLTFNNGGVSTTVKFKTMYTRHVQAYMCTQYLQNWKADYPGNPEGTAQVIVNSKGKPFIHATIAKRIQRIVERAGITKHVTPHLFRHSRITHMINDGVQESVIKMMMWGTVNTTMFETYAHLTGKDIDSEIARVYGIEKQEKKKVPRVSPIQCQHCQHINPPTMTWCYGCGESLDPTGIATEEQIQKFIIRHGKELGEYLAKVNQKKGNQTTKKV
jgi:site-specific recombinase XerD